MLYGKLDFEGYPFYESVPDRTDPLADYKLDTKKSLSRFNTALPFRDASSAAIWTAWYNWSERHLIK